MVSVLASSVVDRGFDRVKLKLLCVASPLSKRELRRQRKDWLARNRGDMSTPGLLFQ